MASESSSERPDWADVSQAAAMAVHVAHVEAERDRARDSAILHEGDAFRLREAIVEMVATGEIVVSIGFFARVGIAIPADFLNRRGIGS